VSVATLCTCGHRQGEHYVKPGWPACGECTDCKEFTDSLVRPELDWRPQRVLWNEHDQCARKDCRGSLRHRSGRLLCALHNTNGLRYCRRCARLINDHNRDYEAREGKPLVEWVWGCAQDGCDELVTELDGRCEAHA
jgi:hypothetical protein